MKWLDRWLFKKLKNGAELEKRNSVENEMNMVKMASTGGQISIGRGPSLDNDRGIRFQVYKANGGMIVETNSYDRNRDRHITGLHIITDDKDLGQELGKIITMETLKQ